MDTFTDYYSHTNSQWLKTFSLPDEYSRYSTFNIISAKINKQIYEILKNLNSSLGEHNHEQKLIVDLYSKFSNYDTRNKLGIKPLEPLFKLVDSIDSNAKLSLVIGTLMILDFSPFISIYPAQDLKNRDNYILNITESSCVLPSQEYYLD